MILPVAQAWKQDWTFLEGDLSVPYLLSPSQCAISEHAGFARARCCTAAAPLPPPPNTCTPRDADLPRLSRRSHMSPLPADVLPMPGTVGKEIKQEEEEEEEDEEAEAGGDEQAPAKKVKVEAP